MIGNSIRKIKSLLEKVEAFDNVVKGATFEPATIADMKEKAKATCDGAKAELDEIKNEIDQWV